MKVRPLHNNVLLEAIDPDTTSPGGIILPDNAQEAQQQGKVLAVGPGRVNDEGELIEMTVYVGDVVLYPKFGGHDVTVDGRDVILVSESQLLGVVE